VRVENYRREIASGGLEDDDVDPRVFPSIHIRRELGVNINLDLSYTSRIQRPGFNQLDPSLRYVDINRAIGGNPNLEPSLTDAYEANFTYQNGGKSFSLTFYDRISEDVFSPFTETLIDGTILTTTLNAGTSEQRGLAAILRGPLNETGATNERQPDAAGVRHFERRRRDWRSEFEYDGSASSTSRRRSERDRRSAAVRSALPRAEAHAAERCR
jgi:outer membrane receptor protein involved in Fe transport